MELDELLFLIFVTAPSGRRLIKRPTETPGLESTRSNQSPYPSISNPQYAPSYPSNSFQNINQPYPQSNNYQFTVILKFS